MTNVKIRKSVRDEILRHGEATYPEECCGFLVGIPDATEVREIKQALAAVNASPGDRAQGFLITPQHLRNEDARLERQGEAVIGVYHSHPEHPAQPSKFDAEQAWPWYTYLVLSVTRGKARQLNAFELDPELRRFRPVGLELLPAPPFSHAVGVGGVRS